jgi:hypothetical protein
LAAVPLPAGRGNENRFRHELDREIRANISRAIDSSPSLRNKKDLIEDFVDSVSATGEIVDE